MSGNIVFTLKFKNNDYIAIKYEGSPNLAVAFATLYYPGGLTITRTGYTVVQEYGRFNSNAAFL